jgi:predicted anti-sigma-YlaC factor YlaD
MHGLIKERLEEYLKGVPGARVPAEFQQHLKTCRACRDELGLIEEQAALLQVLRAPREVEPRVGFYARVMDRIEVEAQQKASFWNVFMEPVFGRRLAVASLALMLILGTFLAFTEADSGYVPPSADTIIALDDHPPGLGTDQQKDRDTILATLASYRE